MSKRKRTQKLSITLVSTPLWMRWKCRVCGEIFTNESGLIPTFTDSDRGRHGVCCDTCLLSPEHLRKLGVTSKIPQPFWNDDGILRYEVEDER